MQIDHFNGEHMKDMISWIRCHVTFHLSDNLTIDSINRYIYIQYTYMYNIWRMYATLKIISLRCMHQQMGIIFKHLHIEAYIIQLNYSYTYIIIVFHFKCDCFCSSIRDRSIRKNHFIWLYIWMSFNWPSLIVMIYFIIINWFNFTNQTFKF